MQFATNPTEKEMKENILKYILQTNFNYYL